MENNIVTSQDKAFTLPSSGFQTKAAAPGEASSLISSAGNLNGKLGSFMEIDDPNVFLQTWKTAEDDNGTILRFVDFGGTERTVSVRIPWLHLDRVWRTDAVERGQDAVVVDEQEGGLFRFTIHPHEIVTLRMVEARQ
jgi:alpha-mannosidase